MTQNEKDALAEALIDARLTRYSSGHGEVSDCISFYMTGVRGAEAILEAARNWHRHTTQGGVDELMAYFTQNVDGWGVSEWFDRLVKAVEDHDRAKINGDDIRAETCLNIAVSSAFRLARYCKENIRAALKQPDEVDVEALKQDVFDAVDTNPYLRGVDPLACADFVVNYLAATGRFKQLTKTAENVSKPDLSSGDRHAPE